MCRGGLWSVHGARLLDALPALLAVIGGTLFGLQGARSQRRGYSASFAVALCARLRLELLELRLDHGLDLLHLSLSHCFPLPRVPPRPRRITHRISHWRTGPAKKGDAATRPLAVGSMRFYLIWHEHGAASTEYGQVMTYSCSPYGQSLLQL